MLLSKYITLCQQLESTDSSNEKIEILKPHITNPYLLSLFTMQKVNVGEKTIINVLSNTTGHSVDYIQSEKILDGRLSEIVHRCLKNKRVKPLSSFFNIEPVAPKDPDIVDIYIKLLQLSTKTKFSEQSEILNYLFSLTDSPYITNIITGDRAIGIQKNTLLKALPADYEKVSVAYAICNNWFLLIDKINDLDSIKPQVFSPMSLQLCDATKLKEFPPNDYNIEVKYDGVRIQAHYRNDIATVYTRNLENVSESLPDVCDVIKNHCKTNFITHFIGDLEVIPYKMQNGTRIDLDQKEVITRLRKYNIREKMRDVKLECILFDIILLNNDILLNTPHFQRRELIDNFNYVPGIIPSVTWLDVSSQERVEAFFNEAIVEHEGVILKPKDSVYTPGKRTTWLKIKPTVPSFDLVVTKAFHGNGQNAKLFSSFEVSAIDGEDLISVSNVGNFKLLDMKRLTEQINAAPHGRTNQYVELTQPNIILEIICEKVNLIEGKISFDFPKVKSIRTDKKDITTITEIKQFVKHYD